MPDRVLFRWKDAAIMGEEGRPKYASVEPEFIGSPVWGKGGAIAALLARVECLEAENAMLRQSLDESTDPLAKAMIQAAMERKEEVGRAE